MPNGGTLRVLVENEPTEGNHPVIDPGVEQSRYVRFTIGDTGPGVPFELQKAILQSNGTAGPNGRTLGRELSSTNAIIKDHGGHLSVESINGHGSIFRASFPAAPPHPLEPAVPDSSLPQGRGQWILVVDDDEAMVRVLQSMLELFGYHVITARDGVQAVGRYLEHCQKVALVLMNIALAGFDGFTAAHALHKINPCVKILAISELKAKTLATKAAQIGISEFLIKPFSAHDLLRVTANILREANLTT
jgi:CheY-like chemotaxis protein